MSEDDNLTTEQLMEAALRTVQQMSPEEKAQVRKEMTDSVQKMRRALKDVPHQLAPDETAQLREQLKLETVSSGTLQEFVEGLELSYRRLSPEQKKQWLKEIRASCVRFERLQKTEGGWIQ